MPTEPADDALLLPRHVDAEWLPRTVEVEGLPVMGWTSTGEPVVCAAEVRAWLRRPDPHGDET